MRCYIVLYAFFFFNDTATTEIYTLSLHDALPISLGQLGLLPLDRVAAVGRRRVGLLLERRQLDVELHDPALDLVDLDRSEEHTSELQSRQYLVCRLLLEKKKTTTYLPFLLCTHVL